MNPLYFIRIAIYPREMGRFELVLEKQTPEEKHLTASYVNFNEIQDLIAKTDKIIKPFCKESFKQ